MCWARLVNLSVLSCHRAILLLVCFTTGKLKYHHQFNYTKGHVFLPIFNSTVSYELQNLISTFGIVDFFWGDLYILCKRITEKFEIRYNLGTKPLPTCYMHSKIREPWQQETILRMMATKYKGFCVRNRPTGKSRFSLGLLESTKKSWGSHALFVCIFLKKKRIKDISS